MLDQLPEEFATEKLIDRLLFIEKVEKGLLEAEEGKVMSLQTAKKLFDDKWLQ